MDHPAREITKIAREAGKLTVRMMKETGIGTGEFDLIHAVRHRPGISQKEISELLNMDKGAVARRTANLELKGYLVRKSNPADGRSQLLYATEKAERLKTSKAAVETAFYEWLLAELPEEEKATFAGTLDKLYLRAKKESRGGFPHMPALLANKGESEDA